jgi:hypothetical protein
MSVMKRLQKYIKNKDKQQEALSTGEVRGDVRGPDGRRILKVKKVTKPVKRKKKIKASKLRSRYNPSTDQWIKYTN